MHTPIPEVEMVLLKPYSQQELADFYKVSIKTFKKWLLPFEHEIGIRYGRFYNVVQVKTIFTRLGLPGKIAIQ